MHGPWMRPVSSVGQRLRGARDRRPAGGGPDGGARTDYLRLLPAANLQSLSVAVGQEGEGLTDRFLHFAAACGARGVTAIRTVGRGAFPQLAYSWDGLMPLDLVRQRPAGWFTTIEFEQPYDEMLATYRLMLARGAASGLGGG